MGSLPPRQTKSGAGRNPHRISVDTLCLPPFLTRQACPFSGILFLEKGERMGYNEQGVAKCYCVGAPLSCIGVWEVAASYTLPTIYLPRSFILYQFLPKCKGIREVLAGKFSGFHGELFLFFRTEKGTGGFEPSVFCLPGGFWQAFSQLACYAKGWSVPLLGTPTICVLFFSFSRGLAPPATPGLLGWAGASLKIAALNEICRKANLLVEITT